MAEIGGWLEECREDGGYEKCVEGEYNNSVKEWAYQESLCAKYEVWRGGEVESVLKE